MGKTDDVVRRFVARAGECPEDAARAAAQVLGGSTGIEPARPAPKRAPSLPMPMGNAEPVSGPRKWLRSATSIFSTRAGSHGEPPPPPPRARGGNSKRFDAPVPLSEFAKRQKGQHTGHGRRDQLTAGERTRILRMLRDEGGRIADEESQVFVGAPPAPKYDFDFDDSPAPAPLPSPSSVHQVPRGDMPAKPAVVVGLAQANSARRARRQSGPPPVPGSRTAKPPSQPPPVRQKRELPRPFEEKTRQVRDDELMAALRGAPGPGRLSFDDDRNEPFDEPTRMGDIDAKMLDAAAAAGRAIPVPENGEYPPRFLAANTEPSASIFENNEDEATRMAHIDSARKPQSTEERTRAVDIRNDPSISDIDWDID
ncbi:MAG TPA: hypothetical protein VLX92_33775, partial [Kofleriaceae bacterium]|nr:hypothetical protein [Kofleriaceae bacterium]